MNARPTTTDIQNYLIQKQPFGRTHAFACQCNYNCAQIIWMLLLFLFLKFYLIWANEENVNKLISLYLLFCVCVFLFFFCNETKETPIQLVKNMLNRQWIDAIHLFSYERKSLFFHHTKKNWTTSSSFFTAKNTHTHWIWLKQ